MLKNLEAEQARNGKTDAEIAEYLNIARETYCKKKKRSYFTFFEIKALCAYFNATFDYLFATEEPRPEKEMSTNAKAT